MNALTLPRKAATLQYQALRLPSSIWHSQVISRFLPEDSRLRLAVENALGSFDETAGRVLGDRTLADRGASWRRRSQILSTAVTLEDKAQARKADADEQLDAAKERVAAERDEARQTRQQDVQDALSTEQSEKQRIARETDAREQAEKDRIEQQANSKKQDAEESLRRKQQRIDTEEKAATAAPKAQLEDAADQKKAANKQRSQANRMEQLADAEADSRRAEREARSNRG